MFWLPLLYVVGIVLYTKTYHGTEAESYIVITLALTQWIPMAAFFYPIYTLWDVYDDDGGKIHFVYMPSTWKWIVRNGLSTLFYATVSVLSAVVILYGSVEGMNVSAILPSLSIVWFYSWLGMFFMTLTKDAIWSTFLSLAIYILTSVGPMSSWKFFNPHDQMIPYSFEVVDWIRLGTAIFWGSVFLIGAVIFLKRRKK